MCIKVWYDIFSKMLSHDVIEPPKIITAVLFRCIGDLSTLPCPKDTSKPGSLLLESEKGSESCMRNRKKDQKTLLNSATALDSYVGWIVASCVTYFTKNMDARETHVVGSSPTLHALYALLSSMY